MAEADLDAILAIEHASFSVPWKRDHFAHELAAPYSFPFVAEHAGVIIGYVCLMSLFEEAQILDIAVAPDQRGRGIARLLMDYAIIVAREKRAELLALKCALRTAPPLPSMNGAVLSVRECAANTMKAGTMRF